VLQKTRVSDWLFPFSAVILATAWALFLPPVKHSMYFNRIHVDRQDEISGTKNHGAVIEDSGKKLNIGQIVVLVSYNFL
jgi:hypothetical protein